MSNTPARPLHTEARCTKCGELFITTGEEATTLGADGEALVEHYATAEGTECGGTGPVVGEWFGMSAVTPRVVHFTHPNDARFTSCSRWVSSARLHTANRSLVTCKACLKRTAEGTR